MTQRRSGVSNTRKLAHPWFRILIWHQSQTVQDNSTNIQRQITAETGVSGLIPVLAKIALNELEICSGRLSSAIIVRLLRSANIANISKLLWLPVRD